MGDHRDVGGGSEHEHDHKALFEDVESHPKRVDCSSHDTNLAVNSQLQQHTRLKQV